MWLAAQLIFFNNEAVHQWKSVLKSKVIMSKNYILFFIEIKFVAALTKLLTYPHIFILLATKHEDG